MRVTPSLTVSCIALVMMTGLLPRTSSAATFRWTASSSPCSSTFRPESYDQHGSCTQSGPGGFLGYFGMGIPVQFVRPASMPLSTFNALLTSHNLKALCKEAHILPAHNLSLPEGMTVAQFEQANRDGRFLLTLCVAASMQRVDAFLAAKHASSR